jgi:hypothetical protein
MEPPEESQCSLEYHGAAKRVTEQPGVSLSSLEYHGEDWGILEEHAKSIIMEQLILSKRRLGYHR